MIYREIKYHGKTEQMVSDDFCIPTEAVKKIYDLGEYIVDNDIWSKFQAKIKQIRQEMDK